MPDLKAYRYDAIQLYDLGFGPRMVSVTPPDCDISPSSKIHAKDRGKAPGVPTPSGWIGVDVNNSKFRCLDYGVAKLWRDGWGANVGFVAGDGFLIADNDQGREFSAVLVALLANPLRRYVLDPKHERDAFFMRVVDFVGDGASVANREILFRNGTRVGKFSILARGKQAVISGVHPGTRAPYAWCRELEGLDQIPVLSEEQFEATIRKFIFELGKLGWTPDRTGPVSAVSAVSRGAAKPDSNPPLSPDKIREKIAEAEALLDEIPNRDAPPGEPPTDIDHWLDVYDNWTSVAYALAAFLGAVAFTPEALALWVEWSDGRAQQAQSSESVWKSVLGQPLRFGPLGLVKLVRALVPATGSAFPDLDPEDPMLQTKTPIWDALKGCWAYCALKGFVNLNVRRVVQRQPFSDMHAYLKQGLCAELRPGHTGAPPSVVTLFLEQRSRLEVFDITYAPGDPRFIDTEVPNAPTLNYWRPSTIQARTVSADQIKPWLDHVLFVLGSVTERDRFIKWCAFVVQHPRLKPNWHFLIMSIQGLGKDTMVLPLKLGVGDGNWIEELIYGVANPFNDLIENKLLIVGETAQPKTGHMSAHDVGTRLKPLLAAPPERFTINKKYKSLYVIPNRIALILFSNELNPLLLDRDQRRVHVVNRRAAKPEPPFYYENLMAWFNGGGSELAAAYLLSYPLTEAEVKEFTGGVAPQTADKIELEHQNTVPQLAALEDILRDAREGVDGTPTSLVATAEELSGWIKLRGMQQPSPQNVRTWLLDMERRNEGVRRLKLDPKAPHLCGVVSDGKHSGRLWLLADKASDGRDWSAMTNAEIITLWKNLPPLPNATVTRHPSAKFPDEEEPV